MPVFNSGGLIREALEQVLQQTYENIEVIVSDNNSTDSTSEICRELAARDRRIKYHRQPSTIGATENFRFAMEKASGEYFMWAAHDDRRSQNYIEILAAALGANPAASLAFTDVAIFDESLNWKSAHPSPYLLFHNGTERFYSRIISRQYIKPAYLHVYGLIRKRCLEYYDWPSPEVGPDRPLIFFLSCRGVFISAPGACFYSFKPRKKKTLKSRAASIYGKKIRPFAYFRLNLACARSGVLAEKIGGRKRSLLMAFAAFSLSDILRKIHIKIRRLLHPFAVWLRRY
jgi:glycosyltransferase involved in cell wall biosynthesis